MFASTTFPTFPVRRAFPVRYSVRTPFLRPTTPAVSGAWVDDAYQLTADLPGVPEDAVAVAVAGRTLTIDVATDDVTWSERIRLPQTLDPEQVSGRYVNGRLTVTIAKTAEAAPRSIAIDTTPARAELAAATVSEDVGQSEETVTSATE